MSEKVQAILARKGLTLYRVSQESAKLYGRSSPYFIPHNLYYDLRSKTFSPSFYQILTLSRISGYRLRDWLRLFGFNLEDITRCQVLLPSKRTIVIDTTLTDRRDWTRWVRNQRRAHGVPPIAPLSMFLEPIGQQQIGSVSELKHEFAYAKIGREDTLAFPELVPGSIVRVNLDVALQATAFACFDISDRIFLIQHSKGLSCCRIRKLANGAIVPCNNGLSFAQVELRMPQEAKIWGTLDLEYRPLLSTENPKIPQELARRWKPQPLAAEQTFSQFLREQRRRMHLSTREAARISTIVAERLNDKRYASSSSSLSDYEVRKTLPRNFHKVIALCSTYGLQFTSLMRRVGIDLEDSGIEPMPDCYLPRPEAIVAPQAGHQSLPGGFLDTLLEQCHHEVPFFLRNVLGYFSDSKRISIDDFFWIGAEADSFHPYLAGGVIAIVNRRRKTPVYNPAQPIWQQPIYILLARDGKYLAACCGIENDKLVIHPYGMRFHQTVEYHFRRDVEVTGQIVAIARRFR